VRLLDLKKGDRVYGFPPRYKPAPIAEAARLRWRIAVTEPGREKATRERLLDLRLGVKPYLPLEHKQVAAGRRRKRDVELPMFQSYLFIPMPDEREIWHEVLHTRGIQAFLSDADRRPRELAPAAVEAIRLKEREIDAKRLQRLAAGGQHPLPIGAEVWVKDLLPFQALLANIQSYDKRGRAEVVLQLEILGRRIWAIEPHRLQAIEV
jgi:transcription antitermination factor NusG